MKVKRFPIDPGQSGWLHILPEGARHPEAEGRITADILIIGAGFAGLSAARALALKDPKLRIAIVDARRVAEGPAGRNSGFMIDLPHNLSSNNYAGGLEKDRLQTQLNRSAIAFAADAAQEFDMSAEAFDPCGKINGAATQKGDQHNQDYAAHLNKIGEECTLLDRVQMRELTGSDYYQSGLFTKGTAMLQPAMYIRSLAAGLEATGVKLFENSPVIALAREGSGWLAETPKAKISADTVILANNGHVESFGYFKRRLVHIYLFASMTEALDAEAVAATGGAARWAITPSDSFGTTMRKISGTGGTRLVVRNGIQWAPHKKSDLAKVQALAAQHDEALARRHPQLRGMKMAYRWGGQLCLSMNTVPAFGEMEPKLFSACCQNGLGTAQGTLAGMGVAELALNNGGDIAAFLSAHDQPSKLPPEPLASIGATIRFWWGERVAGKEL